MMVGLSSPPTQQACFYQFVTKFSVRLVFLLVLSDHTCGQFGLGVLNHGEQASANS
jgi:hypothetical protein